MNRRLSMSFGKFFVFSIVTLLLVLALAPANVYAQGGLNPQEQFDLIKENLGYIESDNSSFTNSMTDIHPDQVYSLQSLETAFMTAEQRLEFSQDVLERANSLQAYTDIYVTNHTYEQLTTEQQTEFWEVYNRVNDAQEATLNIRTVLGSFASALEAIQTVVDSYVVLSNIIAQDLQYFYGEWNDSEVKYSLVHSGIYYGTELEACQASYQFLHAYQPDVQDWVINNYNFAHLMQDWDDHIAAASNEWEWLTDEFNLVGGQVAFYNVPAALVDSIMPGDPMEQILDYMVGMIYARYDAIQYADGVFGACGW